MMEALGVWKEAWGAECLDLDRWTPVIPHVAGGLTASGLPVGVSSGGEEGGLGWRGSLVRSVSLNMYPQPHLS